MKFTIRDVLWLTVVVALYISPEDQCFLDWPTFDGKELSRKYRILSPGTPYSC